MFTAGLVEEEDAEEEEVLSLSLGDFDVIEALRLGIRPGD